MGLLQGRGWSYQRERMRIQERGELPTEALPLTEHHSSLWGLAPIGNGKIPSKRPMRKFGNSASSLQPDVTIEAITLTVVVRSCNKPPSTPSQSASDANDGYLLSQTRQVRARVRVWSHPARAREGTVCRPA